MRVNAFNTERENVADNIGPKAAYMAYQSWMTRNLKERKLPGLKYTHDQLFWISAANVYCEISTPRRLQAEIKYGLYSPGKFRVIGPMSNIPEFSEAFNCSSDSAMNRRNKCEVW
ncbi:Endothelin-converting enzyme 1, partial [Stegodyphus mimosarum]